jgi:uncharacterized protein (TIGR00369 family)
VTDARTLQTYLDEAPLHGLLGDLRVVQRGGRVAIQGALSTNVENGRETGMVHGGVLATLLDTAATFALIAESDRDWTTVDLRIDYLRPVALGTVVAEGYVVHAGRRVGRAGGRLLDATGRECARSVGTFVPAS